MCAFHQVKSVSKSRKTSITDYQFWFKGSEFSHTQHLLKDKLSFRNLFFPSEAVMHSVSLQWQKEGMNHRFTLCSWSLNNLINAFIKRLAFLQDDFQLRLWTKEDVSLKLWFLISNYFILFFNAQELNRPRNNCSFSLGLIDFRSIAKAMGLCVHATQFFSVISGSSQNPFHVS